MWESNLDFAITYFSCITTYKVLYYQLFIKGRADKHLIKHALQSMWVCIDKACECGDSVMLEQSPHGAVKYTSRWCLIMENIFAVQMCA